MELYHFTSFDNFNRILEYGGLKESTWLTREKEKRHQYWAINENRDKTQVRIQVSTLNFVRFDVPEDKKQDYFKLGAFNAKLWTEKKLFDELIKPNLMNWFLSTKLIWDFVKVEKFDLQLGRYVHHETKYDLKKIMDRLYDNQWTDWYLLRWNKYYSEKYGIELGQYNNGVQTDDTFSCFKWRDDKYKKYFKYY